MYQHDKKNTKGSITRPKFYNSMPFYFPSEVILVELKDGEIEQISQLSTEELDLTLVGRLIQQHEDTIRDLQERLADYEQEIYELDTQLNQRQKISNSEASNMSHLENSKGSQLP
ncbi:MAG TPA: hypothetical protein VKA09_14015 [Nitrososphaeraceae archaeon]|nr:hypothetical protein [Nitrososphaeraceae archaeon]